MPDQTVPDQGASVRLADFARRRPSLRPEPDESLEASDFRERIEHLWRQLESVPDLEGKAVALETRDPFCAMTGLVALWAVGGVGVPVDPDWPAQRKAQACAKADVAATLAFSDAASTPRGTARALTRPDYQGRRWPDGAYILFTSGSSGDPKGVLVGAEALESRLCDLLAALEPQPGGVIAAITTPTFDISLLEMLLPFASDVTGWFPGSGVRDRMQVLAKELMAVRPAIVQGTPTLFSVLTSIGWQPPPGTDLWCGGEALPAPLALRLLELSDRVCNLYGPTEATIWATAWPVTRQGAGAHKVAPIGLPLPSTKTRLEPAGNATELWLAGPGLATEYVQEPERTASSFPVIDGQRWYRTGDLCRADKHGLLHFLGRRDNQVKVRGFRVELEEVEGELVRMPGVSQVAVVPEIRDGVAKRLVAVVVAGQLESREIRRWCGDNLPGYMCPAKIIVTDELPRLASGKVDRRELERRFATGPSATEG